MCKVLTVALVLVVDLPCSFPMGFLSDRLYAAIARKAFVDTHNPRSVLYAVSKVVKTPIATAWAAEHYPGKGPHHRLHSTAHRSSKNVVTAA